MNRVALLVAAAGMLLLADPPALGQSADVAQMADLAVPTLRFDPFERQDTPGLPTTKPGAEGRTRAAAWTPRLVATLLSRERPMADLGGTILAVGEETHGFRLLEVRAFEAVFEKDGSPVVLYLRPPPEVRGP